MIPEQVRIAASEAFDIRPPSAFDGSSPEPGTIAVAATFLDVAAGSELRRVVAIVAAEKEVGVLSILLASSEIENATDFDLILGPGEAGLPYSAMVQSELYGPVFVEQIQGRLGAMSPDQASAARMAIQTDGASLDGYETGVPLGDPTDPRRAFKVKELDELESLVADCRQWLSGEPAETQMLDPELLLPPPQGTPLEQALDQFLELLDVVDEMEAQAVSIPESLFAGLVAEMDLVGELSRWRTEYGVDAARVLSRLGIAEDDLDREPFEEVPTHAVRRTQRAVLVYVKGQADSGRHAIDIHSTPRRWVDVPEVELIVGRSGRPCRARVRLLEEA